MSGAWGSCSNPCGGSETRTVECVDLITGGHVFASYCAEQLRPVATQACSTETCATYAWSPQQFHDCDVPCGGGSSIREVLCVNIETDPFTTVDDSYCDASVKMTSELPCNRQPCGKNDCTEGCAHFWSSGAWSECSQTCGEGEMTRQVDCKEMGPDAETVVDESNCASTKPLTHFPCNLHKCAHYEITSDWGECDAVCGDGNQHREVICVDGFGAETAASDCIGQGVPATSRPCRLYPCPLWYRANWTSCDAPCNEGERSRSLSCRLPAEDPYNSALAMGTGYTTGTPDNQCGTGEVIGSVEECSLAIDALALSSNTDTWILHDDVNYPAGCSIDTNTGAMSFNSVLDVQTSSGRNGFDPVCRVAGYPGCPPASEQPLSLEACNTNECPQFYLDASEWSVCTLQSSEDCGMGLQTRDVFCAESDGTPTIESNCALAVDSVISSASCEATMCTSYTWDFDELVDWTECSHDCGDGGNQSRAIFCWNIYGNSFVDRERVADSFCAELSSDHLVTFRTCNVDRACTSVNSLCFESECTCQYGFAPDADNQCTIEPRLYSLVHTGSLYSSGLPYREPVLITWKYDGDVSLVDILYRYEGQSYPTYIAVNVPTDTGLTGYSLTLCFFSLAHVLYLLYMY